MHFSSDLFLYSSDSESDSDLKPVPWCNNAQVRCEFCVKCFINMVRC